MRFIMVFTLAVAAALMLSSCASSYAKRCVTWMPYKQYYEVVLGGVDRFDVFRCTEFDGVP